jgi:hydroxylamine dehydrogenase
MRRRNWIILSAFLILGLVFGSVMPSAMAQPNFAKVKEFRIERSIPPEAQACIECHKQTNPGLFGDWANSRHANANITCLDCHLAQPGDQDVAKGHEKYYGRNDLPFGEEKYKVPIATVVTPKDCSRCHPDEVTQYSKSKHANTIEIMWKLDPWLNKGMNSDNERKTGCYHCHGTVLAIDDKGKLDPTTWPNVGVGTTEHGWQQGVLHQLSQSPSLCGLRSPAARGLRLLPPGAGPSPDRDLRGVQARHHLQCFRRRVQLQGCGRHLVAGHGLSGAHLRRLPHERFGQGDGHPRRHRRRISWETQAPLTVRPADFKPFPAGNDWQVEREKMKNVCRSCHGDSWIDDFYQGFDKAVEEYNEVYFKPAKAMLDDLVR